MSIPDIIDKQKNTCHLFLDSFSTACANELVRACTEVGFKASPNQLNDTFKPLVLTHLTKIKDSFSSKMVALDPSQATLFNGNIDKQLTHDIPKEVGTIFQYYFNAHERTSKEKIYSRIQDGLKVIFGIIVGRIPDAFSTIIKFFLQ